MKATDLMIGNLVQFDEDTCVVEELRVDGTAVVTSLNTDLTSIDGDQVDVEELYPIPLTEEILAKNGYKSTQGLDFYWLDDKKHCCIKNYDGKRLFCYKQGINDVWLVVKYVHQLQHLLRLVGIEKEIKL